jgi:FtsH-binding integral membrane protein
MPPDQASHGFHWGQRALDYARSVANLATAIRPAEAGDGAELPARAEIHPGRGSATQAEKRAAELVQRQLHRLGYAEVEWQAFRGLRSIWLFLAQAFGFALAGHAAFWLLASPAGLWPALIVSLALFAFSAVLLWRKFTFQPTPLHASLPHGPSQNVLAALPPQGEVRQRIVLLGHLDSHRAVLWYANDFMLKVYFAGAPLALYGVSIAPALYLLADLSGWMVFAYCAAVFGLLHFAAWMTAMSADLGPYSPGANDNASAVGSLLALAERLKSQPLEHTQVWLAFTGCEETGCGGLIALLNEYGAKFQDALWLDLELVGIGDQLVYLTREGVLRKKRIPPGIETYLKRAADHAEIPLHGMDAGWSPAFTEAGALWEHNYNAACLTSLRNGKDELPEWHRLTDTSERLEAAALDRAHRLVWSLLQIYDEQS